MKEKVEKWLDYNVSFMKRNKEGVQVSSLIWWWKAWEKSMAWHGGQTNSSSSQVFGSLWNVLLWSNMNYWSWQGLEPALKWLSKLITSLSWELKHSRQSPLLPFGLLTHSDTRQDKKVIYEMFCEYVVYKIKPSASTRGCLWVSEPPLVELKDVERE